MTLMIPSPSKPEATGEAVCPIVVPLLLLLETILSKITHDTEVNSIHYYEILRFSTFHLINVEMGGKRIIHYTNCRACLAAFVEKYGIVLLSLPKCS